MPELRDLLEGAVDHPAPLDMGDLASRVAHRRRRHRVATAAAALLVVCLLGGALALVAQAGGNGDDVETIPPATDDTVIRPPTTTSSTPSTTSTTPVTTTTTAGTATGATVPGGPGSAPPCAEQGAGEQGASVEHPERAPLWADETFDGGVRWAICGADSAFEADLLNLRSDDGGETWTVTNTGFGMSPHHAGDDVQVSLTSASSGQIRLVGRVGEQNDLYATSDGGLTWQQIEGGD